jgi:hypothetical protein
LTAISLLISQDRLIQYHVRSIRTLTFGSSYQTHVSSEVSRESIEEASKNPIDTQIRNFHLPRHKPRPWPPTKNSDDIAKLGAVQWPEWSARSSSIVRSEGLELALVSRIPWRMSFNTTSAIEDFTYITVTLVDAAVITSILLLIALRACTPAVRSYILALGVAAVFAFLFLHEQLLDLSEPVIEQFRSSRDALPPKR